MYEVSNAGDGANVPKTVVVGFPKRRVECIYVSVYIRIYYILVYLYIFLYT